MKNHEPIIKKGETAFGSRLDKQLRAAGCTKVLLVGIAPNQNRGSK